MMMLNDMQHKPQLFSIVLDFVQPVLGSRDHSKICERELRLRPSCEKLQLVTASLPSFGLNLQLGKGLKRRKRAKFVSSFRDSCETLL